jgi:D-alanine transaminase
MTNESAAVAPAIAYVNGEFGPLAEARISILDRGFLFADGVYEVTAVLKGRLVDQDSHMARLERSLREISMPMPETAERILEIHHELIAHAALDEGMIYLQVTRGAAPEREFGFPEGVKPSLVMFTNAKCLIENPVVKVGIPVRTVPDIRWARRDIKSLMLLAQVLAKHDAKQAGGKDAWMVAPDGTITEAGAATAYIVQGGTIVTRPNSRDILPGCTRKAIVRLAAERGMTVEERAFTVAEALAADEAFTTSATSFVMPVIRIDEQIIGDGKPGPVSRRLREIYLEEALRP